jgi:two-component system response regulator MprA
MQILLLEDDKRMGDFLKEALENSSFSITLCKNLNEADTALKIQQNEFDLAILDRMVAGEEGGQMIAPLRLKFPTIGIIILSSLDIPTEKAKWLEIGADDYMGKPFALEELLARIRVVLRNKKKTSDRGALSFKDLRIDLANQQCWVKQKRLDLTKKELQVLMLFIEKPGRVFNKFQIMDRVWQMDNSQESNVSEVTIKNIRRKLTEASSSVGIENKRHLGYWIEE